MQEESSHTPIMRLSRLRQHDSLRRLVRETILTTNDLVMPLFVKAGIDTKREIAAMPGQYQLPLNALKEEAKQIYKLGIPAIILFGIPDNKDQHGSDSYNSDGIIQRAINEIKSAVPDLMIISDICLCEYTDHGHCGVMDEDQNVDNDKTLTLLQKQVISHARAGSDVMAPSGMMDGMVAAIRDALDMSGFSRIPILSYAAKYASSFYGPFRDAAEGAPRFGDRRSYQMDIANGREAFREVALDIEEGADMIMVKPALSYLDVIARIRDAYPEIPLAAYSVSGEYTMTKVAAQQGLIDEKAIVMEQLTSIKRAGADFILTYFAKDVAQWLGQ
ncbi:MAG: porphobilinogen synthase [Pseudomonadota bacterium]